MNITYLTTPWSRVLFEKLTGSQLVEKFPAFYGTRRLITAFTNARHLPLSWDRPIQSVLPHPTSWRSILIVSSHLRMGKLGRTKNQSRPEAFFNVSWHDTFLRRAVSISSNSQAGGPPLVGCPRLLIQYIRSYPPYWRPFHHPQPEDLPCRGARDPLIMELRTYATQFSSRAKPCAETCIPLNV
jgi:hypothetical protein